MIQSTLSNSNSYNSNFYKGHVPFLHLSSCIVSLKRQHNSYSRYHFWGSKKLSLRTLRTLFSSNDQRLSALFRHNLRTCQHDCLVPSVRWAFLPPLETILLCKHDDLWYTFLIHNLCSKLLEFHLEKKNGFKCRSSHFNHFLNDISISANIDNK